MSDTAFDHVHPNAPRRFPASELIAILERGPLAARTEWAERRRPPAGPMPASPARKRVLHVLALRQEATATEIAAELHISRQAAGFHLRELERDGLLVSRKQWRERRFRPSQ